MTLFTSSLKHDLVSDLAANECLNCSLTRRIPGATPGINFRIIESHGGPPRDFSSTLLVDLRESILHPSPFENPSPVDTTPAHAPCPVFLQVAIFHLPVAHELSKEF